jgi:hypothetical protein
MTAKNILLGIDPGTQTGVATFIDGSLHQIQTLTHEETIRLIRFGGTCNGPITSVVFEDANLQKPVFARNGANARMILKIARNVGMVQQMCKDVQAACESVGMPFLAVSPLKKGAKLSAAAFMQHTGWQPRTSQHGRDAAMVAWKYRNMSEKQLWKHL